MQQENNFIISSTEAAKAVEAEMVKSESVQETEQDETQFEESETTEQEDQTEETEGSENEQEDESDDQDDSKLEEKPKKKNGFKKRIDKLSKRASLAEQERDYWREQALKSQPKQETQPKDEVTHKATEEISDKPKAPRAADFATFDEYEAARDDYQEKLADWKIDQKDKSKEAKSKQESAKSEYEKSVQNHNDRIKEFKKTQTDFDEVVSDFISDLKAQKIGISLAVEQAILESDLSAEITYELAMKPQEFARINSMNALAAAREIGKIEARLSNSKESSQTQTKNPTKAPAPITPVGKSYTKISKSLDDDNLSFSEYEKLRNEELKKRK